VLQIQAERFETKIRLFYERPADVTRLRNNYTGARLEPIYGCYVGAFIDRDDGIQSTYVADDQRHGDHDEFNQAVGKDHAIFFQYIRYGRPFPDDWTGRLKQAGAAVQIAWEPKTLAEVQDDEYLRGFARDAKASESPVFLRFASEMNGAWVPYHGDPAAYKEKFALVARVMHEEAPNVAMVWCPNEIPEAEIPLYYPGPGAVDWVGLNFYSVLYNDADRARGAEWRNPADTLRYIYNTYSKAHPIMIGEWAATHQSVVDKVLRPDFAINKIGQLYSALPRIYPRLKAVHWLSMNTLEHAMPGRQLNDYSLMGDPLIAKRYGQMISSPYFLSKVPLDKPAIAPYEIAELTPGTSIPAGTKLSAWVKTYEQRPTVQWVIGGTAMPPIVGAGDYEVVAERGGKVELRVKDSSGRLAGSLSVATK
jgi:hypothetical protein